MGKKKTDGKIAVAVLQIRTAFCAPLMKTGALHEQEKKKRACEAVHAAKEKSWIIEISAWEAIQRSFISYSNR